MEPAAILKLSGVSDLAVSADCSTCVGLTAGWCDPVTCPIDSDSGIGGSLQNTCTDCCSDDALLVQCPLEEWNLLAERCENELAVWAGAVLSGAGMSGLFLFQVLFMFVPLYIFYTRNSLGAFDKPENAEEWPQAICCLSGDEYLSGIMKSHIVCVLLGGCIPFCGLPCLPVVWLWSFVYYPGFLMRNHTKIYIYVRQIQRLKRRKPTETLRPPSKINRKSHRFEHCFAFQ